MDESRPPGIRILGIGGLLATQRRLPLESKSKLLEESLRRRWTSESRSIMCETTTAATRALHGKTLSVANETTPDLPGKDKECNAAFSRRTSNLQVPPIISTNDTPSPPRSPQARRSRLFLRP